MWKAPGSSQLPAKTPFIYIAFELCLAGARSRVARHQQPRGCTSHLKGNVMNDDGNEMPLAGHLTTRPASNTNPSYFSNQLIAQLCWRSVLLPN